MSEPVNPRPDYWLGQIVLILIALAIFIAIKGVL